MLSTKANTILNSEPPRQDVHFHPSQPADSFAVTKNNVLGLLVASRGRLNPICCGNCHSGLTPFSGCYSYDSSCTSGQYLGAGACSGYIARNKTAECEYSKLTDIQCHLAFLTNLHQITDLDTSLQQLLPMHQQHLVENCL